MDYNELNVFSNKERIKKKKANKNTLINEKYRDRKGAEAGDRE